MADHMQHDGAPEEPWTGGWLVAGAAGLIAAILARFVGDVGLMATLLVAVFVFLVFGVLLGLFWGKPAPGQGHGDDHAPQHVPPAQPAHVAPTVQPVAALTPVAPVVADEPVPPAAPLAHAAPLPVAEPVALAEPVAPLETLASLAAEEPLEPMQPVPVSVPLPTQPVEGGGQQPQGLAAPRDGSADALQTIEGIGPVLEKLCHEMGIFHFDQIAGWGPGEVAWMDGNLKGFRGRVSRDRWVAQAKLIGEVGVTAFLIRARANDY